MAALAEDIKRRALEVVPILQRFVRARRVYVFGSHVNGRPDECSDIDIGAFVDFDETWDFNRTLNLKRAVHDELGWELEVHLFQSSTLKDIPVASFEEYVIENGVKIWEEKGEG